MLSICAPTNEKKRFVNTESILIIDAGTVKYNLKHAHSLNINKEGLCYKFLSLFTPFLDP
jgi:hypothetical protein